MTGQMTRMKSRDGFEFDAYHVAPTGARKGGVIVVQEIFGLSDHIKAMADMFGAAGYEAIAPSMYDRARPGFVVQPADVGAHMEEGSKLAVGNGPENAMNDVGGCFDVLSKAGPVFITGFCYGGSMSWLAAHRIDGLAAASCYYGGNIADMAGMAPKCPVICHFGKKDPFIPNEKVAVITEKNPGVPVYWYDADHGFARKGSYSYDEASANLAHQRTLDLFASHS